MRLALAVALCLAFPAARGQDTIASPRDSVRSALLPAVEIAVTRDPRAATLTVPYAVSIASRNRLDARGQMQDVLSGVPGLFVANRNNPTQDPRIVLRGVGARTAFGVRGVRVLHDGIPLTVADGQTPLDYLDVESVDRIEVIRGSASSLYGNSAGGVVAFSSAPLDRTGVEASLLSGSHGLSRAGARVAGGAPALGYSAGVSHAVERGFRERSRQRVTRGSARVRRQLGASSVTAHLLVFDMPLAENPGALTSEQLASDRRMAEPAAVARAAGKQVRQAQAALSYTRDVRDGDLSAILFAGRRALDNPLTFAVIDLDRTSGGLLLRASRAAGGASRVTLGVDVQQQDDDRQEYENCHDATVTSPRCPEVPAGRGAIRRTQRERVSSVGPYINGEIAKGRFRFSAGARGDAVVFDVRDRLVTATDPDESGRRTMRAFSPHIGALASIAPRGSLYANLSSAFETPTATELGNKPDGSAGVNNALEPQRSRTLEAGAKGAIGRTRYDLAVFSTAVRDELVPFEIAGGGGRRFFRNAGRTRRRGLELALASDIGPVELRSALSANDFEFVEFSTAAADFSGKTIPGVPARFTELSATWNSRRVQAGVVSRFVSSIIVDDANTSRAPGYEILSLRARGELRVGRSSLRPGIAVDNLFGRKYVGAVSVNAAGGRYYEPAPRRTVVGSLSIRF